MVSIKFPYSESINIRMRCDEVINSFISVKFPYVENFNIRMQCDETLDIRMKYDDSINMIAVIDVFTEKRNIEQPQTLEMYLMHNKLAFGVDPLMFSQLDTLTLGMIDPFRLNVQ